MTIKAAICQWLIDWTWADYNQALALYGQLKFKPALFNNLVRGDIADNRQIIRRELGHALKFAQIPDGQQLTVPTTPPPPPPAPDPDPAPGQTDQSDQPDQTFTYQSAMTEAALALNVSRCRKERGRLADSLHDCSTNEDRAQVIVQLDRIQSQLVKYSADLTDVKNGKVFKKENPAADIQKYNLKAIPADSLDRHKAITGASSIRSKTLGTIEQVKNELENHPEGHPMHIKLKKKLTTYSVKWKHYDDYIKAAQNYVA